MRRLFVLGAILAASLWLAAGALAQPPWEGASTARLALTDAEAEIALGDAAAARARIAEARSATSAVLAGRSADLRDGAGRSRRG